MKTTIATVKNEFRLTEWSAQIQAQKSSGLTVHKQNLARVVFQTIRIILVLYLLYR